MKKLKFERKYSALPHIDIDIDIDMDIDLDIDINIYRDRHIDKYINMGVRSLFNRSAHSTRP